ncbi:APC family permease [Paludicola sp. MB14-C6]|uniref:APC family permease n=1 Tax=Paludihabitans sp. MB14-C6 TaxID=3070656 RepID=UPI0027DC6E97|nr:APC family permease [Paludicola sp. MB14-C6]WMJ24100.1 APC family permease [Paludicola sp. MB14-C6]
MNKENSNQSQPTQSKLNRSLKLIYVYAIAAGAIFTFIGYWDSIFYEYCGSGTFLAFILMTLLILPIAFVYCEMAPLFPKAGGELIYNTVGINKHFGFLSAWLIMAAWIAVPPAAVMAIVQWVFRVTGISSNFKVIEIIAAVLLIVYFILSLQNVEVAGKIQLVMLILAISGCIIASLAFIFSGSWSLSNFSNFFDSQAKPALGIPLWIIGLGFLITPFFGFETVPQMIEEGDFEMKDSNKAIWGSVVSCGVVYAFFFVGLGGMPVKALVEKGGAANGGFLAITMMEQLGGGWKVGAVLFGICAILCAIGTCLLGFWLSTVRLLYAMGRSNFLPKSFAKLNKHHQPILPNIMLLVVSIVFLILQNSGTFMNDFFNLMSFACACAYAITMISAIRIHRKHSNWKSDYHLKGGNFVRYLALIISVVIAFFCTLGQGIGSWVSLAVYMGIGLILWLWMVVIKWRKTKVVIDTPDGPTEF